MYEESINFIETSLQLFRETIKYQYEYFKHMTTLCTGSILIIVALLEAIFREPECVWVIVISILGFFVSLIGSLAMLGVFGNYMNIAFTTFTNILQVTEQNINPIIKEMNKNLNSTTKTAKITQPITNYSFLLGVLMLLVFTFINLID